MIWNFIKETPKDFFNGSNEIKNLSTFLEEKLNNSLPSEEILKLDERKRFTHKLGIYIVFLNYSHFSILLIFTRIV